MITKMFYKFKNIDGKLEDHDSSFYRTYDSLENQYFYFSRQNQLNDPFDMYTIIDDIPTDKEIRKYLKDNKLLSPTNTVAMWKAKLLNYHFSDDEKINDVSLNQIAHVLSLTPNITNEVMWGLYASNYTGIAIGYETKRIDGRDVLECDNNKNRITIEKILNIPDIGSLNFAIRLLPVKYTDEEKDHFSFYKMNYDVFEKNAYRKKITWNFEQEYRSVIRSGVHVKDDLLWYYKPSIVKEIVFGYKCDESKKSELMQMIKRIYGETIKFYIVKPDRNNMSCSLEEIES